MGHSPALLADGINSTSDVAYGIIVKVFIRKARKPADDEHPYGHRQLESIAAVVVGAFVLTTAVAIFWDAINRVYDLLAAGGRRRGSQRGSPIRGRVHRWLEDPLELEDQADRPSDGQPRGSRHCLRPPQRYLRRRGRRHRHLSWPATAIRGSTPWPERWWPW
ncbi:MAG: cation transporter [Candidatus Moduliflexus flocculans]|nr:cation transporter [Candidatus Moduliflexus flocculans]